MSVPRVPSDCAGAVAGGTMGTVSPCAEMLPHYAVIRGAINVTPHTDTGHSLLSVNDSSGVVTVNIVMIKIDGKQNTIHSNFLHEVHI